MKTLETIRKFFESKKGRMSVEHQLFYILCSGVYEGIATVHLIVEIA